eukprot:11228013-Lingulodinium_polyedra.AAC.1
MEKRLKEALERKVTTTDSVNHLMDSKIGTNNERIEDFVKQISAKERQGYPGSDEGGDRGAL